MKTDSISTWSSRFERLLVYLGDRLNPILVKEVRQSLKSRQFVLTFSLLLLFCWLWSIFGVAIAGPGIHYGTNGPSMFFGYYVILSFPLLVIVPAGAYRGLVAEQEERTYEMLSITSMGPRQIVRGKLGSAVMQMILYLSAVSPCLAFTYMLRGISLPTVLFILFYVTVASLALSVACLLLATLATEKYLQVILSVFVIIGLFLCFWAGLAIAMEILEYGDMSFRDDDFQIFNTLLLSIVAGGAYLAFEAAASRITFASDNRSTRVRFAMLVLFALFTGSMALGWIQAEGEIIVMLIYLIFVGIYWYVMGSLMIAESPCPSLRVRRQLPRSVLGRVFLTWLNPGPASGFMFAIAGMIGSLLLVFLAYQSLSYWNVAPRSHISNIHAETVFWFGFLGFCYVTFFLGLGLLAIRTLRKISPISLLTSVLIQIFFVFLFSGVPAILHASSQTLCHEDYSYLQVVSPIWTAAYILDQGNLPTAEAGLLLTVVPLAAIAVFLLNLRAIVREVDFARIAQPQRVAEDDAAIMAQKHPALTTKTSPWDE